MRINRTTAFTEKTHEGATAARMTNEQALRRSVMSCFLWENQFYESGEDIAIRIKQLAKGVSNEFLSSLSIEARHTGHLRHVPLLLLCSLIEQGRGSRLVSDTIEKVISRADELTELLAIYWKGDEPQARKPLANQLKKGLAKAFLKFNSYELAKYNRDGEIKLRDVLFLSHAKPDTAEKAALFKQLVDNLLPTPDTWEVALSAGKDKKTTFERLLGDKKLGYLALLRNLRNMHDAGVDRPLIRDTLLSHKGIEQVYPFRFVAAARACPPLEPIIDEALHQKIASMTPYKGTTLVVVDCSGSMSEKLSAKSDLTRNDAAAALASILKGDTIRTFAYGTIIKEIATRKGMAGVAQLNQMEQIVGSSTNLGTAMEYINKIPHDRLIVITDEQSRPGQFNPVCPHAYLINVASAKNGVGYGKNWVHIDGFSENTLRFIHEYEKE